jgi:glycosyltransferase involved in cell wall biosynthesis
MHVLHIMAGKGNGGAETYSTDVILALHKKGVAQTVVLPHASSHAMRLQRHGVHCLTSPLDWPFPFLRRKAMAALIRRIKPDLIHAWMRRAASYVPKTSIPTIGWFGGYYKVRHFQHCDYFLAVTDDIIAHIRAHGIAPAQSQRIPTFSSVEVMPPIDRAALDTPYEKKVLLTLSRLHPKKGLDILLRALVHLPDCVVWFAGDGPLETDLKNLATKLGVKDRVRFLGWRNDRGGLLRAADICVLPSRYEPFGTVIIEAWQSNVPLVAAMSAGPKGHIRHEENGLLVPIDDVDALTTALRRVLDDRVLRQNMVLAGQVEYLKKYTEEAVTEQMLIFYRGILAAPAKAA